MDAAELLARQCEEPLLQRSLDRLHFHVTDTELWRLYEDHFSLFWTAAEVSPTADVADWEQLTQPERDFISHVLAFFASADGIVFENCALNFGNEVTLVEARFFYAFQAMMENVHSQTYMSILTAYVADAEEQRRLIHSVHTVPSIQRKAEWAMTYLDADAKPFALRLIAFAVVEGVFFSGSFCAIFWLRAQNPGKLEALTFSNQLISRDEGLHTQFAVALFRRLVHRPSTALVHELVARAVDIEVEYTVDALKVPLIGMNSASMAQHIKYVADRLLVQLGYEKLFGASDPFGSFMLPISLRTSTNFFEGKVAEYALAPSGTYSDSTAF